MTRRLTPEDVRTVAFDTAPLGRRGYLVSEVDAFLDLIEDTLAGHGSLSAENVRLVAFTGGGKIRNRGYDEDQVDAFLDLVAETLAERPS